MKTKLKLRQGGVRNHPLWHIIVQPEKKNLRGKYIERVGYWMPRQVKTVPRGIVLNKHKIRYWLSVGAQPTNGVIRILSKLGPDFFPKGVVPGGTANTYEKPPKHYRLQDIKKKMGQRFKSEKYEYRQMLQE